MKGTQVQAALASPLASPHLATSPRHGAVPPVAEITQRLAAALADRYRIQHLLGEGGMATVYLAYDAKHDRHVALKA